MLKPIKPKKYITGGAGLDFARRIIGRSAARGLYESDLGELVFAAGATGEREDITSVLELLENVLDALKNGLGTRGGRLSLYVSGTLSLVRNILSVGGNSSEYRAAAAIYNEICERLSGGVVTVKSAENKSADMHNSDNFDDFDDLREKLHDTVRLVKNAEKIRREHNFYGSYSEYTARELPAASALGASAGWTLRMAKRDPELLKTVKSNRSFLELALRCEEMRRRSMELRRTFSVLAAALNERQSEFLGRFIRERGLFSSVLKERGGEVNTADRSAEELKYLAEHSSERELSGFFREFYRELRNLDMRSFYGSGAASSMLSATSVFTSEKDMREFFETADLKSVERLCERLSEQSRGEVNVLREAEKEYERLSEKSEELVKRAFSVLERQMGEENFSWENFREKMRLSEHLKEYVFPNEENISDVLYSADNELVLSFAEFAVNRARELQSGSAARGISLEMAEKLEQILYYGQSEISEKCAEIQRLISTADRETAELSRLYAEFTGLDSAEGIIREIRAAESGNPENRLEVVRELLSAVGQENAEAQRISEEIADFTAQFGSISFSEILERSGGYSKLGALFAADRERFSERVSEWFSEFDGKEDAKTLERLRSLFESRGLLREFERAMRAVKEQSEFSQTENLSRAEEFSENFSEFERTANGFLSVLELCENHGGELSETFVKMAETLEKFRLSQSADIRRQTASELLKTLFERSFSENSEGRFFSELKAISEELSEISSEEQFSSEKFFELESKFYELAEKTELEYSETSTARDNAVQNEINALRRELLELRNSVLGGAEVSEGEFNADSRRYFERISRLSESTQSEANKSISEYVSRLSELAKSLSERSFSEKSDRSVRERFTRELYKALSDSAAVQSIGDALNVLRLSFPYAGMEENLTISPQFEEAFPAGGEFSELSERLVYGVSEMSESSRFSTYSELSNSSNSSNISRVILRDRDIEKILPKMSFIALRRNSVERQTTRAERELLIRLTKAVNSPTERIFRQTSEQTERTDYSAAELFYTEEYFDSSKGAVSVNYAVPPKSFSDNSDEVKGRLSGLKSKLDDVSRQLERVKNSDEEMTKQFMLKSERAVLEKEIKSSIEQDITLAGKRHGIY